MIWPLVRGSERAIPPRAGIHPSSFRQRWHAYSLHAVRPSPMEFLGHFRRLTRTQRNTFIACFMGWSLDAFDFFILVFCVSALATHFQQKLSAVAEAFFWTLAMRPVGALVFGFMARRVG